MHGQTESNHREEIKELPPFTCYSAFCFSITQNYEQVHNRTEITYRKKCNKKWSNKLYCLFLMIVAVRNET